MVEDPQNPRIQLHRSTLSNPITSITFDATTMQSKRLTAFILLSLTIFVSASPVPLAGHLPGGHGPAVPITTPEVRDRRSPGNHDPSTHPVLGPVDHEDKVHAVREHHPESWEPHAGKPKRSPGDHPHDVPRPHNPVHGENAWEPSKRSSDDKPNVHIPPVVHTDHHVRAAHHTGDHKPNVHGANEWEPRRRASGDHGPNIPDVHLPEHHEHNVHEARETLPAPIPAPKGKGDKGPHRRAPGNGEHNGHNTPGPFPSDHVVHVAREQDNHRPNVHGGPEPAPKGDSILNPHRRSSKDPEHDVHHHPEAWQPNEAVKRSDDNQKPNSKDVHKPNDWPHVNEAREHPPHPHPGPKDINGRSALRRSTENHVPSIHAGSPPPNHASPVVHVRSTDNHEPNVHGLPTHGDLPFNHERNSRDVSVPGDRHDAPDGTLDHEPHPPARIV